MFNMIKKIYLTIIALIFVLAMYVMITGNNPLYKIDDMTRDYPANKITDSAVLFSKDDQTLITPDGKIRIISTEKITNWAFDSDYNRGNLVISYEITPKHNVKPNTVFNKYVSVKQGAGILSDGGISPDVGTEAWQPIVDKSAIRTTDAENGKAIIVGKVINYDSTQGAPTIDIYLNNKLVKQDSV